MAFVKVDKDAKGVSNLHFQKPAEIPKQVKWLRILLITGLVFSLLSLANSVKVAKQMRDASEQTSDDLYDQISYHSEALLDGRWRYCQENRRECRQDDLEFFDSDGWEGRTGYAEDSDGDSWGDDFDLSQEYTSHDGWPDQTQPMLIVGQEITTLLKRTMAFLVTGIFLAIFFIIGRYIWLILRINRGHPFMLKQLRGLAIIQISFEVIMAMYAGGADEGLYTIDIPYSVRPAALVAAAMLAISFLPVVRDYFSAFKFVPAAAGGGPMPGAGGGGGGTIVPPIQPQFPGQGGPPAAAAPQSPAPVQPQAPVQPAAPVQPQAAPVQPQGPVPQGPTGTSQGQWPPSDT